MTQQTGQHITRLSTRAQNGPMAARRTQSSVVTPSIALVRSSPYTFGWDYLSSLLSDPMWERLTRRHYAEIALDQDDVPLDPDWLELVNAENMGRWRIYTARHDKTLVGYSAWWFQNPWRYASTLYCHNDMFYLDPKHRKGWTGYRFMKANLDALPKPCKVQWGEKTGFEGGRVGLLMQRLGLRPTEVQHTTFLGGK